MLICFLIFTHPSTYTYTDTDTDTHTHTYTCTHARTCTHTKTSTKTYMGHIWDTHTRHMWDTHTKTSTKIRTHMQTYAHIRSHTNACTVCGGGGEMSWWRVGGGALQMPCSQNRAIEIAKKTKSLPLWICRD